MTLTTVFLFVMGMLLLGFGIYSLRTGKLPWGPFITVRRDSFPLQYWIGVSAYLGSGVFVLCEASHRAV